jgi:ABC-2 type transport system ATP-binding protein
MNANSMAVEVQGLTKRYGATTAADNISFDVRVGEILGIVGPNGAGKTTTVECVAGLRVADSGTICVLGLDPASQARELRHRVGIQLQSAALPDDILVAEALDLFRSFYRAGADWRALADTWGLGDKLRSRFSTLSGGQKQRLFIALALINDPQLLFLDEITTGLDPQARRTTWEMIQRLRQEGKTVVLVTHFMDEAERLCDRVAIIDHGRLVALDTPGALIRSLGSEQRICFPANAKADLDALRRLPGVTAVEQSNGDTVVKGTGSLLLTVAGALLQWDVSPDALRLERASLEDVFLGLTGRRIRE